MKVGAVPNALAKIGYGRAWDIKACKVTNKLPNKNVYMCIFLVFVVGGINLNPLIYLFGNSA